jgi:ADP-heptose:LPS heptosyltransferase
MHRHGELVNRAAHHLVGIGRNSLQRLTSIRMAKPLFEPLFHLLGLRSRRAGADWRSLRNVLIIRLDQIGDAVMTTPLLRELKRHLPRARLSLVVKPSVLNLVELCPYVDRIHVFDWNIHGNFAGIRSHWRALKLSFMQLWPHRYDLAIVPRRHVDYYHGPLIAYFSGSRWRLGSQGSFPRLRQILPLTTNGFFTHLVPNIASMHEVEHNLSIVKFLGGIVKEDRLELWLDSKDDAFAEDMIQSHGVHSDEAIIALCPGGGSQKKVWPAARYAELARRLQEELRARFVVIGGREDESVGLKLTNHLGGKLINAAGKTTLRQAAALMKRCLLYIGNDTGPMHLAAAVGIPVVEISWHPGKELSHDIESPRFFGPWRVPCRVVHPPELRKPCLNACTATHAHCILGVTVEMVMREVDLLLMEIKSCAT